MTIGGSIMSTDAAMTDPQSVAFCWKNDCRPSGRVKTGSDFRKTMATE